MKLSNDFKRKLDTVCLSYGYTHRINKNSIDIIDMENTEYLQYLDEYRDVKTFIIKVDETEDILYLKISTWLEGYYRGKEGGKKVFRNTIRKLLEINDE